MKILHTEASCGWGGQEIRILSEAKGLQERGHELVLACPPEARIFSQAAVFGIQAIPLPINRKNLRGLLAMRKFLGAHSFDVINTHSSTDAWLAAIACSTLPHAPPIVRTRHISAPIAGNLATRWLYTRGTARIATTGEALRQQLLDTLPLASECIISVPTGVDTLKFTPATEQQRQALRAKLGLPATPLVGIIATLRSWKGHRYLVDAMTRLPEDVHLVIVGDGPQYEALGQQIAALGLSKRVTLAGVQSDVLPWFQSLDVFVLPSYANEGVPQALMQAMACGLPCITTDVGAIPELAIDGQTAQLIPTQDSVAIANAVTNLLTQPERGRALGEAARVHVVNTHGRERMLDQMEALFFATISDAPG